MISCAGSPFGLLGDDHSSDDAVQQAAVAALGKPRDAAQYGRAWLATATKHAAFRLRRTREREERRESRASEPASVDRSRARERTLIAVTEAVRALDPSARDLVLARYFEARSVSDIARENGVARATIQKRLARALEALRSRLEREEDFDWRPALAPFAVGAASPAKAAVAGGASIGAFIVKCAIVVGLVIGSIWGVGRMLEDPAIPELPDAPRAAIEATIDPVRASSSSDSSDGRPAIAPIPRGDDVVVKRVDGSPVPGAVLVWIPSNGGNPRAARTDDRGRARIVGAHGTQTLWVAARDVRAQSHRFRSADGAISIVLREDACIRGRVTVDGLRPTRRVRLGLRAVVDPAVKLPAAVQACFASHGLDPDDWATLTDSEGRFQFVGFGHSFVGFFCPPSNLEPAAGQQILRPDFLAAPALPAERTGIRVTGDLDGVVVALARAPSVAGRLLLPDGRPAGGARIVTPETHGPRTRTVVCGPDGRFTFPVASVAVDLTFWAESADGSAGLSCFRSRTQAGRLDAFPGSLHLDARRRLPSLGDLTLKPRESFPVRVLDQDDRPVRNAVVAFRKGGHPADRGAWMAAAPTDRTGRTVVTVVPEAGRIYAGAPGFHSRHVRRVEQRGGGYVIALVPLPLTGIHVTASPQAAVRGLRVSVRCTTGRFGRAEPVSSDWRAVDARGPTPLDHLHCAEHEPVGLAGGPGRRPRHFDLPRSGVLRVPNTGDGAYIVLLEDRAGFEVARQQVVVAGQDATCSFEVPRAGETIFGRVVVAGGGLLRSGALHIVDPDDPSESPRARVARFMRRGIRQLPVPLATDGTFRIEGLHGARIRLRVTGRGVIGREVMMSPSMPSSAESPQQIVLTPDRQFEVRIVDTIGEPVAAKLSWTMLSGSRALRRSAGTAMPSAIHVLTSVEGDTLEIRVAHGGGAYRSRKALAERVATVVVPRLGHVRVAGLGALETVTIRAVDGGPQAKRFTLGSGRSYVPPGEYRAVLRDQHRVLRRKQVRILPGPQEVRFHRP